MDAHQTLPLDTFWEWLRLHPNCILRAGTPESILYDDDDLHWVFGEEGPTLVVQMLRGKRLVGEVLIAADQVTYVESLLGDQDGEVIFELISETPEDRIAGWFFVLTHGYGEEDVEGVTMSAGPHVH